MLCYAVLDILVAYMCMLLCGDKSVVFVCVLWQGELVLLNKADGVEHCFTLRGKGEKPLPIDTINLKMTARQQ